MKTSKANISPSSSWIVSDCIGLLFMFLAFSAKDEISILTLAIPHSDQVLLECKAAKHCVCPMCSEVGDCCQPARRNTANISEGGDIGLVRVQGNILGYGKGQYKTSAQASKLHSAYPPLKGATSVTKKKNKVNQYFSNLIFQID